ncbi:Asp-tRNAAsn/Glu-tRNAGln amidotransferase A subunit [Rhizobiales bacterium GAS113]|nr:Asp-tRNAAsn/Glu-tRNAGln amidotransferase A subunit [Rhizobiales bacterium GAS113]
MISAVALRARLDAGELTPEAAIRQSLEAVERADGELGAFVATNAQGALASATGQNGPSGPLSGIAIGVKDIIDTADMPTAMGSAIYEGWRPKADAALVMLARRAGASILGKTATTAFAHADPPGTRNPHDPAHTPGGSSSGSAAAVGAGMVPLAFGTQTGGSVIRPASFCGVAAIKPSFRLLPTAGIKCYSISLDTAGLFAATVADAGFALAALTGRDLGAPASPQGLRIGVTRQGFAGEAEPAGQAALDTAIKALERDGATLVDRPDPEPFATAWKLHPVISDGEALRSLAWEWQTQRALIPPKLTEALSTAEAIGPVEFDEARRAGKRARVAAHDFFEGIDAVITFSAPGAAPKGLGSTGDPKFNRLWTLLGVPCVNVPGCLDAQGLPVGVQVVAPFGRDAMALAVASKLEHALSRRVGA